MGKDYNFAVNEHREVIRSVRRHPPAHYKLDIDSIDSLKNSLHKDDRIESTEFTVGRHTWTISVHLKGNDKEKARGSLSLYLNKIKKHNGNDKVNVSVRFFIYDHERDQYLIIQDSSVKEYDAITTSYGIEGALDLTSFYEKKNGFVRNGRCRFGAEIFYHDMDAVSAGFSPKQDRNDGCYHWKFDKYSSSGGGQVRFPRFNLYDRAWTLEVHPKDYKKATDKYLSLSLHLDDASDLRGGNKLYAEFELGLKNLDSTKYMSKTGKAWFKWNETTWRFNDFIQLNDLLDPSKGFLIKEALHVKVTIKTLFVLTDGHEWKDVEIEVS